MAVASLQHPEWGELQKGAKTCCFAAGFFVSILSLKQAWFDYVHKKTTINRGFFVDIIEPSLLE